MPSENYKRKEISTDKNGTQSDRDVISSIQSKIEQLEQELIHIKQQLRPIQNLIHQQLQQEIQQLARLSELHKKYQIDKKSKRKEQKQRGKNYKKPEPGIQILKPQASLNTKNGSTNPELKKLFREAIVKIHPDKINHKSEAITLQKATDLTAQLNQLYKNGDLDDLKLFYSTISQEFTISGKISTDDNIQSLTQHKNLLLKKQQKLITELDAIKTTRLFYCLSEEIQTIEFIENIRETLFAKIKKLERRTRKMI
jgi:hypothetical protein